MDPIVREGDTVIMFAGMDRINSLKLKKGQVYNTKHGSFPHNDIIGKPYGTKLISKQGGWLAVLRPTPELWTAGALQHRTQIIYTTDISVITMQLELRPGCIVVESGTGSGSLSQALARTIAPTGHLYTFEFHEQRAAIAREIFEEGKLDKIVTVTCRDVCELGYNLLDEQADAVMLDLPCPWLAVPHAARVLKHYGTICNFSPCIEQVQRACAALEANGFKDIRTVECLMRPFEVRPTNFKPLPSATGTPTTGKRGREEVEEEKEALNEDVKSDESDDSDEKKETGGAAQAEEQDVEAPAAAGGGGSAAKTATDRQPRPMVLMRGHTSYLTFARRIRAPSSSSSSSSSSSTVPAAATVPALSSQKT